MATFKAKDGTQIYYKDCGAGKPVLFSHGWPLDGDMWDSQLNYLAERGFRAIAFDRRGFGRSDQPWNGYDYDTFASDINDLITTLDLQDVTLVGFSMGGGDVTRYINNYGSARVAGLALLGAVTPIFGKSDTFPQGVDQSVFDGIRDGLRKDRAQFISDFATPFYGINAGQTVSAGALTDAEHRPAGVTEGHHRLRDRVRRNRFPPGYGENRRADAGDPRQQRPDRAV